MMNMGLYIKELREQMGLTQEELGQCLDPPVNRAAVNKWETGKVENIKRCHIKQLAKKFGVTPCELMCFDSSKSTQKIPTKEELYLLQMFSLLNQQGKEKLLSDLEDMTSLEKYTKKETTVLKNA